MKLPNYKFSYASCLSLCVAVFLATSVSAGTYWVATNGVDAVGRGSENAPFETIQYAIEKAESDSTIWVKPGVYDKGWATNRLSSGAIHTNRVSLTKKIHLRSTKGAAVTHIVGAPDPNTGGVGPAAIRCMVSPNENSDDSTVVGFTLRDGYGDSASHRSGGFLQQNGRRSIYFQDCIISNCAAVSHGGARGGTFARCLFTNNRAASSHGSDYPSGVGLANLVSCVIVGNGSDDNDFAVGSDSILVNCVAMCNRGTGVLSGNSIYNTVVCGNTKADYAGTKKYNSVIGGYPVVAPLERDWRVVSGSAADGAGDPAYLASSIPFTVIDGMTDTDFAGNAIDTSGASVHAGAVQATVPVTGGVLWLYGPLSCNGAYVADGVPTYAQSTNGLSQWRVDFAGSKASGATTNYLRSISRTSPTGNVTLFPGLNDSLVMMAPPKTGLITTNTPAYNKALWVSPTGHDTDNDGSEGRPYATIQKAVDVGGSRTVIFLAPGLYDAGGRPGDSATAAPYGSSRVWIDENYVRIVGKSGAGRTVIAGEPDSVTAGCGDGAVRCVGGAGGDVIVQGVTLSNGWTRAEANQFGNGAAVRGAILADSVVTCCHGYNNVAYSADLHRCKVFGNEAQNDSLVANYSRVVCSWFGPNTSRSSIYYGYIGSQCEAWFSTLVVANGQSAFSQQNVKIYNCLAVGGQYVKAVMESKGNLFWKFSDVDAAAVGTFTDANPRLASDRLHVKADSPAIAAGVAPSTAGYAAGDAISLNWHNYSSADVDGNLLFFNTDGTAMVGSAHETMPLRGFVISFR